MKIEEAVRDEIKEVTAYKTPDGKLYPTRDDAVQAYLSSRVWHRIGQLDWA